MCSNHDAGNKPCGSLESLRRLLRRLRLPRERVITNDVLAPADPATATPSPDMTSTATARHDDHPGASPLRIFVRTPRQPTEVVVIRCGLTATATGGAPSADGEAPDGSSPAARELAMLLRAEVTVTPAAMKRLFGLWNAVNLVGADEIGDGSIQATATATATSVGIPLPLVVRSIGATVFSDGMVSFYLVLEGVEAPLWLVEQLDLGDVSA